MLLKQFHQIRNVSDHFQSADAKAHLRTIRPAE